MDAKGKAAYWDSLADYDLETAKAMLESGRFLYVGFMCQQTIEKALKAVHWKRTKSEPEYIHALVRLAKKSGIFDEMDQPARDFLEFLEPLSIEARYPTHRERLLASLTRERCITIVDECGRLLAWLRARSSK